MKLQKTQHSSTRVDWFGQHAHFHIWSYSAVWMGDNEAGPFQHSWHFDRERDVHCWDGVVREWCHVGEPKRSRCGILYPSPCPSSSGYDLNCLNTSAVHYHCEFVWHQHWWYCKALWTEFPTKWQALCLRVGSKYHNECEITKRKAYCFSPTRLGCCDERWRRLNHVVRLVCFPIDVWRCAFFDR